MLAARSFRRFGRPCWKRPAINGDLLPSGWFLWLRRERLEWKTRFAEAPLERDRPGLGVRGSAAANHFQHQSEMLIQPPPEWGFWLLSAHSMYLHPVKY